jgi:anti-anti-sigma regulatory factor
MIIAIYKQSGNKMDMDSRICRTGMNSIAICELNALRIADLAAIKQVEDELMITAEKQKIDYMIVDCSRVKNISSMFFSMLLRTRKTIGATKLRVSGMNKDLRTAYKACRMDAIIPVYDSIDSALKGL